jgi:hypothetical protein
VAADFGLNYGSFMKILGRWEPHRDSSEIRYRAK